MIIGDQRNAFLLSHKSFALFCNWIRHHHHDSTDLSLSLSRARGMIDEN